MRRTTAQRNTLSDISPQIVPHRTVLFLGAGACVPSGAPTGKQLASMLSTDLAGGEHVSDDLMEACSILENRYGRKRLVEAVRKHLSPLRPTGGLLGLPQFDWPLLYTTNFDRLVEAAYRRHNKLATPIRSNYEYDRAESAEGTPLFKLHGCIGQDTVDGNRARLVLTERDYEEYSQFREVVFARLQFDLASKDVLVIGQSLRDPHLRRDLNHAAQLQRDRGAPGRLFALIYEEDRDRAELLEGKGFTVAFGGIDEFVHAVSTSRTSSAPTVFTSAEPSLLPARVGSVTTDVGHAQDLTADAIRLYNGSPATYADIASDLTIRRSVEAPLINELTGDSTRFLVVTGAAGVGKTTLGRRLMRAFLDRDYLCWEHKSDFPLKSGDWVAIESRLREDGRRGALLIDDCTNFMNQVNRLAERLASLDEPALSLVLTANTTQWIARMKSPALYTLGHEHRLSQLSIPDIEQLVRLVENQADIRELVDTSFARLSPQEKVRRLRNRCSADMYVCLKNIFATEALDTILLREYADLDIGLQDIYRHVAALEATGTRVHRQLILRLLNISGNTVSGLLALSEGLITEYDIKPSDGLYGWETRHQVVAQTIARYKFADQDELYDLLRRVIEGLNPTIYIEVRTIRDICSYDYGIQRLTEDERQIELYQRLIELAPGERVPRQRLIRTLLRRRDTEAAAQAIREAEDTVGRDPLLSRYKVRLALQRAEITRGIMEEDRRAMLLDARRLALDGIDSFPNSKFSYQIYGDVGVALADKFGDTQVLDDAIAQMEDAAETLLDPELGNGLRTLNRIRRGYPRK